jgi:4'-phosphopantetheinyl transferase
MPPLFNPPIIDAMAIHVWHASLAAWVDQVPLFEPWLRDDERKHAARLMRPQDHQQFVVCRGLLRKLLEAYGVAPAQQIEFVLGPHQKPRLHERHGAGQWEFNLSHAGGMAVFALTRARSVGVDVEDLRHIQDADQIVEQQFAPDERAAYESLNPRKRPRAFAALWTRKEAFLKALGTGLHHPLNSFAMNVDPDEPARLLHVDGDPQAAKNWTIASWWWDATHHVALTAPQAGLNVIRLESGQP